MRIKGIGITLGVVLASSLFFSNPVSAASSISVSSSGEVSFGDVSPSPSGTLVTGQDTLNINTDCTAGTNVYATSTNGGSTSLINTNAVSNNTIAASSNTIGSASSLANNTWGLNTVNNSTYYGLPSYSPSSLPTAIYSGTNTVLPVYYGIKVTNSITPGTYTGEVLYTVTVNNSCLDYTVKFNKNTNDASGDMSDQSILPTGGTLSENSFTYSGYAFLGWSLDPAGKTGTATNGIGTAEDVDFADKASFPGSDESILPGSETTLYAIWEKQIIYMQDWVGCAKLAEGGTITLTDKRDDAEYTVKKFGSGSDVECWMTQNLTLGYDQINDTPKGLTLTKDDTNIPDYTTYYLPPAGKRGSVTSSSTSTATNTATFNGEYETEAHVQYAAASQTGSTNPQPTGYYNFNAASLGYSYYEGGASSGNTPRDICPAGWQLPRGSNTPTYSFYWLDRTLGGSGDYRTDDTATRDRYVNDFALPYSGEYVSSSLRDVGSEGNWWSSTVTSTSYGFSLYVGYLGFILPQDYPNKYSGFAVRCVAKQFYTVNYDANGGIGEMVPSRGYNGGSILSRNTFTREGYYFAGWSTNPSATTATYADGAIISTDLAPVGGSITLYAVWAEPSQILMQANNICSTVTAGNVDGKILIDSRDEQTYSVYRFPTSGSYPTRMAGYCIMTQDLSLGYVTGGSITRGANLTLTTADSAASATIDARTGASDWSDTDGVSNRQYINGPQADKEEFSSHSYYSFGAAQAVCPKGWRLPTSDEVNNIITFMGGSSPTGSSTIRGAPYNFIYGGYYSIDWSSTGDQGNYWTSIQNHNASGGYALYFSPSGFYAYYALMNAGFSVRCIAQP